MVLTRSKRKLPETPESLQEPEPQPPDVVGEPDSGLGRQSEAETEEDTEEDDYTGFYTVVEKGGKAPNIVVAPTEGGAEDNSSSEDEFGLRDMVGTGVIGALPVVTAMPRLVSSDDEGDDSEEEDDISLSDTEARLLAGRDVGDQDTGEAGGHDADQGHDTAGDPRAPGARQGRPREKTKRISVLLLARSALKLLARLAEGWLARLRSLLSERRVSATAAAGGSGREWWRDGERSVPG